MTRRVLVTGAAGNIGSVVMRDLAGEFDLVGLDVAEAPGVARPSTSPTTTRSCRISPASTRSSTSARTRTRRRRGTRSSTTTSSGRATCTRPPCSRASDASCSRAPTSRRSAGSTRNRGPPCSAGAPPPSDFRPLDASVRVPAERRLRREQGVGRGPRPGLLGPPRAVGHLPAHRPLHPRRQPATELAVGRWLSHGDAARAIGRPDLGA